MICKKCKQTVKVVTKFLDEQLSDALEVAHLITNEVAKCINNPLFQLLVSQLPQGVNTNHILSVIEKVLITTGEVIKCDKLTGIEKINCLMQALNLLPKDERNAILARLKSALTAAIDGNRFEKFVYDTAGQFDYFNEKIKSGAPVMANSDFTQPINENSASQVLNTGAEFKGNSQAENTFAMPISERPAEAPPTPQAF